MKLKYYLRGLGMGILFATIIMTISSVIHKNDISDEEIIKRAQKLGMVMSENSENDNSLWGSTEDTEANALPTNTEGVNTDDSQSMESKNPQDTQDVTTSESGTTSEKESEKASEKESEKETEKKKPTKTEKKDYVQITISDLDGARHVSEKLEFNGLVKDAEDFREYLAEHGYSKRIRSGTFEIPVGASYKEICEIIVNE